MPQWAKVYSIASRDMLPLRFSASDELTFRESRRRSLVYARTGIFLVLSLGFGLAPFYQQGLFRPTEAVEPVLVWLECVIVLPLLLAAVTLTVVQAPQLLRQAVQSAAVMVSLLAVIALRYFALEGDMAYPSQMTGVVMIAVAFFGGFSWRRIAFASAVSGSCAIALEFALGTPATAPALQTYTLVFMMLIAVAGSYTQETLMRYTWWESQQLRRVRADLRLQSLTDELTGHYNRRGFTTTAEEARALARSKGLPCALLFVDVDDLKGINDHHGHEAGDQAIVAVGEALRVCTTNTDIIARIGGDEFIVFAVGVRDLESLRHCIVGQLEGAGATGALPFPVSASIGAIEVDPMRSVTMEAIVAEADALMFQDKRRLRVPSR